MSFLIDGFNLYHALDFNSRYHKYKWVSLSKLANCYLTRSDSISTVHYFTALASWNPGKTARHRVFIQIQQHEGVEVVFGEFKRKDKYCNNCQRQFQTYEEKQTDVNIALKLFELAVSNSFDRAIIISGDTDLLPAVRSVQSTFPDKQVGVVIPIGRHSENFKRTANFHHKMKEQHLASCVLADPYDIGGKRLWCPANWK